MKTYYKMLYVFLCYSFCLFFIFLRCKKSAFITYPICYPDGCFMIKFRLKEKENSLVMFGRFSHYLQPSFYGLEARNNSAQGETLGIVTG